MDRFAFSVAATSCFLVKKFRKLDLIISAFPNLEITKARRLVCQVVSCGRSASLRRLIDSRGNNRPRRESMALDKSLGSGDRLHNWSHDFTDVHSRDAFIERSLDSRRYCSQVLTVTVTVLTVTVLTVLIAPSTVLTPLRSAFALTVEAWMSACSRWCPAFPAVGASRWAHLDDTTV